MSSSQFNPSIKDLVSLDNIPSQLGILQGAIDGILDNTYYKDLILTKSIQGDSGYIGITLVFYKSLGFEFPGTGGLALLLNPDATATCTEVPLSFFYQWEILKYINDPSSENIGTSPEDFFNFLLEVVSISPTDLLINLINNCIDGPNPIDQFVTNFNTTYGESIAVDTSLTDELDIVMDLIQQIESLPTEYSIGEIIFNDYLSTGSVGDAIQKITTFFNEWIDGIDINNMLELLSPDFTFSIDDIDLGLAFPLSVLRRVDPATCLPLMNGTDFVPSILTFNVGSLEYSTGSGFKFLGENDFDFPASEILKTGLILEVEELKADFSTTTNIPEADADNRPPDFIGAYVTKASVQLPKKWFKSPNYDTAKIVANNLLVGTGGISGQLALEIIGSDPESAVTATFGSDSGFEVGFTSFDVTFQQNAIISSNIKGFLKIKGFKDSNNQPARIDITGHIGTDGDFYITASETDGIDVLKIPDILDLRLDSLTIGKRDGKFYAAVSGLLDFADNVGGAGSFLSGKLPKDISIKKMLIWEDGSFEFEGGALVLPNALTLAIGPVKLSVTAIHMGTHEQLHGGVMRKYKYFGFDGGISIKPGGVDARGDGIKFYFTVDDLAPKHTFVRISGIAINLTIPGNVKPEQASVLLNGYLSMKQPEGGDPSSSTVEYAGGINFALPKIGMGGSAAMRYNPEYPAFLVDVGLEIASPIPLGATGLGIYGFRGLFGKKYVASKDAAQIQEDDPWYMYYKAKVPLANKEGVEPGKFAPTGGFSVGAGVSLATTVDSGKAFSSKLFFLLSIPNLFLFEGQAAVLRKRIGLNTQEDAPFYALIVITNKSVEAALGVNYKIPEPTGKIAKIDGLLEVGFFFGNSAAWYVNIGRDQPYEKRVRAKLLELVDTYFYMMLSSSGIRAGAGAELKVDKKFGPARVKLRAYLDVAAKIAFKPKQIGGSIQAGAELDVTIFGVGIGFSLDFALSAEAPRPFIIAGKFKVCVRLLFVKKCATVNLSWNKEDALQLDTLELIQEDSGSAVNVHTKETFLVKHATNLNQLNSIEDIFIVPMDSFVDIEFKQGVNPLDTIEGFGGISNVPDHIIKVAPQKAKGQQVKHKFKVTEVNIKIRNGSGWDDYHVYEDYVELGELENFKNGFWQRDDQDKYTKLRLLAQSPFSYLTQGYGGIASEMSVTLNDIYCAQDLISKECVTLSTFTRRIGGINLIPALTYLYDNGALFFLSEGQHSQMVSEPFNEFSSGMKINGGQELMITFDEPTACAVISLKTLKPTTTVEFYQKQFAGVDQENQLPYYVDHLVRSETVTTNSPLYHYTYESLAEPIDKILIKPLSCESDSPESYADICCEKELVRDLGGLLNGLANNQHLTTLTSPTPLYGKGKLSCYYKYLLTCSFNLCGPRPLPEKEGPGTYNCVSNRVALVDYSAEVTRVNELKMTFNVPDCICYNVTLAQYSNISTEAGTKGEEATQGLINWSRVIGFECWKLVDGPDRNGCYTIIGVALYNNGRYIERINVRGNICLDWKYSFGGVDEDCYALLYELCHMTVDHYEYNELVVTFNNLEGDDGALVGDMLNTMRPIWRPDSKFAVEIKTEDEIYVDNTLLVTVPNTQFFGFKTAGPPGYFHEDKSNVKHPIYENLLGLDREDQFRYTTLQHYIDYQNSYPNADGRLTKAKPLYYVAPELSLVYRKDYVKAMYKFYDYSIQVLIKDPAELYSAGVVLSGEPIPVSAAWEEADCEVTTTEETMVNGLDCVSVESTKRFIYKTVFRDFELKPLKCYTAVFQGLQSDSGTGTVEDTREVHRYAFETSRYPNFNGHIQSFILEDEDMNQREAVFEMEIPAGDVANAVGLLDPTAGSDDLLKNYMSHYDRVLYGGLKLRSLPPAITTEFNVIRDDGGAIFGLLVRSPEPFNDPKMPAEDLADMITCAGGGDAIISEDCANVLIPMTSIGNSVDVTFLLKAYDTNTKVYSTVETENITITIP